MLQTVARGALFVCGRCLTDADRQFNKGTTTFAGVCIRCGGQAVWLLDERIHQPRVAHQGVAATCSTSAALARFPLVVWDVNGYYRELGVAPQATREEIRRAYQGADGSASPRLTYVVKQLLNPETRAAYDACRLGEIFFDRYYQEMVLRRIKDEAAEAVRDGGADVDDLSDLDLSDALNNAIDMLDKPAHRGKDGDPSTTPWGYYLWRSSRHDPESLSMLRSALVSAYWEGGITTTIGVGYHGEAHPLIQPEEVDGQHVIFFSDSAATRDLIEALPTHINALPKDART